MAAPTVRARTAPVAGLSATSPGGTAIGDAVIVFSWEQTGAGVPTHTLQSGFVELFSQPHDDGNFDGRLSVAYKIATGSGATSYQAYASSVGTTVRTGIIVLTVGTHSLGATQKGAAAGAGFTNTGTTVINPPAVTLGTARDWLVIAFAGWHMSAAADNVVTVPASYSNLQQVAGSSASDVASAERERLALASEDPGTFGDSVTPNGSSAVTVGIPAPVDRAAVVAATGAVTVANRTFFSIESRAAAIGATAAIASAGEFESPVAPSHERAAAIAATGAIASAGTFLSVLERSAAVDVVAAIAAVGEFETPVSLAILLVVGNAASMTASDTAIKGYIEDLGHTVTVRSDETAENTGGFDGIAIADSCSSATLGSKYNAAPMGLVTHEPGVVDELRLITANASNNQAATTQINILVPSHPIFDGPHGTFSGSTVTFMASGSVPYVDDATADPAAGVTYIAQSVAAGNRKMALACDAGATLTSGTAEGKRAFLFPNDGGGTLLNATGEAILKNAYAWAFEEVVEVLERAATLAATGTIASSGISVVSAATSFSATGAIASAGTFLSVFSRSAAVGATASVASSGHSIVSASVAIGATATIASRPQRVLSRSSAISATGAIATSATFLSILSRSAAISATGAIASGRLVVRLRSASLSATAAVTVAGEIAGAVTRSVAISGVGGIAASGRNATTSRSVSVAASASLTVAGSVAAILSRSASLEAVGAISVAGAVPSVEVVEFPVSRAPILSTATAGRLVLVDALVLEVGSSSVPILTSAGTGRILSPDDPRLEVV